MGAALRLARLAQHDRCSGARLPSTVLLPSALLLLVLLLLLQRRRVSRPQHGRSRRQLLLLHLLLLPVLLLLLIPSLPRAVAAAARRRLSQRLPARLLAAAVLLLPTSQALLLPLPSLLLMRNCCRPQALLAGIRLFPISTQLPVVLLLHAVRPHVLLPLTPCVTRIRRATHRPGVGHLSEPAAASANPSQLNAPSAAQLVQQLRREHRATHGCGCVGLLAVPSAAQAK